MTLAAPRRIWNSILGGFYLTFPTIRGNVKVDKILVHRQRDFTSILLQDRVVTKGVYNEYICKKSF